jgi:hypothetical protein
MISVVIVATSLIVVVRAYSYTKQLVLESSKVLEISRLLENQMMSWEDRGVVDKAVDSGEIDGNDRSWFFRSAPVDGLTLNLVTLEIKSRSPDQEILGSIQTYLRDKKG